ncbi:hypothetical protein ACIP9X_08625 [Arthrobacter sp. NPDC093125]
MSAYGGHRYGRGARRESRRRQLQFSAYVGLALLAVATAAVVVFALQK